VRRSGNDPSPVEMISCRVIPLLLVSVLADGDSDGADTLLAALPPTQKESHRLWVPIFRDPRLQTDDFPYPLAVVSPWNCVFNRDVVGFWRGGVEWTL
jgi:hypothetical protein